MGKRVMVIEMAGKNRREKPKRRWLDRVKDDIKAVG